MPINIYSNNIELILSWFVEILEIITLKREFDTGRGIAIPVKWYPGRWDHPQSLTDQNFAAL